MSNDSPIHYWDPKRKKWFYYDDEGKVCIEADTTCSIFIEYEKSIFAKDEEKIKNLWFFFLIFSKNTHVSVNRC